MPWGLDLWSVNCQPLLTGFSWVVSVLTLITLAILVWMIWNGKWSTWKTLPAIESTKCCLNARYGISALLNLPAKNLPDPIFAFAIKAGSAKHLTSAHIGHHAKTDEWRINELRVSLLRIHL